jgi:hypothetical protein
MHGDTPDHRRTGERLTERAELGARREVVPTARDHLPRRGTTLLDHIHTLGGKEAEAAVRTDQTYCSSTR